MSVIIAIAREKSWRVINEGSRSKREVVLRGDRRRPKPKVGGRGPLRENMIS